MAFKIKDQKWFFFLIENMLWSLLQPNGTPALTDANNQQLDRR